MNGAAPKIEPQITYLRPYLSPNNPPPKVPIADAARKANKQRLEAIARMDKANEYLKSCECVCYPLGEKETNAQECVYIKDGVVVAFAHYEPKQGGFYAFNNEGQGMLDWRPQVHLANLRRLSYPYFNEIKKAAFKSPEEWFK